MINQYTESNSAPSSDIQNLIANKIALLDQYVLMQTGQYEWTGLVYNPNTKNCTEYIVKRSTSTGYNNYYTVEEKSSEFDFNVNNEYYVFSNVGYGRSLSLPVHEGVQSHSLIIICLLLLFGVVFKGVLFKCLRFRRH